MAADALAAKVGRAVRQRVSRCVQLPHDLHQQRSPGAYAHLFKASDISAKPSLTDWAGSDGTGVGQTSTIGNVATLGGGSGLTGFGNFTGHIAAIRFYEAALTGEFSIEFDAPTSAIAR